MSVAPATQTDALSCRVLSQLPLIKDESFVQEILENIDDSSIPHHRAFYQTALDFFKAHRRFPDVSVIQDHNVNFKPDTTPVTLDLAESFRYRIKVERVQTQASDALMKKDFDSVQQMLSSLEVIGRTKLFTEDDAIKAYESMALGLPGLKTGIEEIDTIIKGMYPGRMVVIAAPPSNFKTTMGISIAYNAIRDGRNGIYMSFELMAKDVWFNFFARHSREMGMPLKAEDIKNATLDADGRETLKVVQEDFKKILGRIRVLTQEDFGNLRFTNIYNKFVEIDRELTDTATEGHTKGLDFFVNDYIQRCGVYAPSGVDITTFLDLLISYFNTMAITYQGRGLIAILLAQVQRMGQIKLERRKEGQEISASTTYLAGQAALDRDAHIVIINSSPPAMRLSNLCLTQVVKNRSGRIMDTMVQIPVDPQQYSCGNMSFADVLAGGADAAAAAMGDDPFFST